MRTFINEDLGFVMLVLVLCSLSPYSCNAPIKMKDGIGGKDGIEQRDHGFVLKKQT
jgi:hypothetical protein